MPDEEDGSFLQHPSAVVLTDLLVNTHAHASQKPTGLDRMLCVLRKAPETICKSSQETDAIQAAAGLVR